jgi:hypothetical protein
LRSTGSASAQPFRSKVDEFPPLGFYLACHLLSLTAESGFTAKFSAWVLFRPESKAVGRADALRQWRRRACAGRSFEFCDRNPPVSAEASEISLANYCRSPNRPGQRSKLHAVAYYPGIVADSFNVRRSRCPPSSCWLGKRAMSGRIARGMESPTEANDWLALLICGAGSDREKYP